MSHDTWVSCPDCGYQFTRRGLNGHLGSSVCKLNWANIIVSRYELVPRDPTRLITVYKLRLPSRHRFTSGFPLSYRWYVPRVLLERYKFYRSAAVGVSVQAASALAGIDYRRGRIGGMGSRGYFDNLFAVFPERDAEYLVQSEDAIRKVFSLRPYQF